jgi:hypothetical protein
MTFNRKASLQALLVLVAAIVATNPSPSQTQKQFANQGVAELGGTFSFQSITPVSNGFSGNNYTVVSFSPSFGYFVADGWEIGVDPFGVNVVSGGGSSFSQLNIFFNGAYNFRTENAGYPFIEGLIGYTSEEDGAKRHGASWGLRGGIKAPVAGQALVNVSGQYLQVTLDPEDALNRSGYNQFSVVAGLAIWL